jgi:hypothetical protein
MKHRIVQHLKLIGIALVLAGIASYVHATVATPPPANPPANNTTFPIHVGASSQQKLGGLGVDAFNALQSAQFESNLYLEGSVQGNNLSGSTSTVFFGEPVSSAPRVAAAVTGSLTTNAQLRAGLLSNNDNKSVCADSTGRLILCESAPRVILTANPNPVTIGSSTSLEVFADNFSSITTCTIDQGVGVVSMAQTSGGSTSWESTTPVSSGSISGATIFSVRCTGLVNGIPAEASATRLVGVNNGSSGYYAHCFIADTVVTMADGSTKPIQEVEIGDVLKGEKTNNTVLGFHQPTLGDQKLYGFNGETPFVTAEHPFMTTEGWKSIDPIQTSKEHIGIEVTELEIGDTLITEKGFVTIKTIGSTTAPAKTQLYNFLLDGDHTYYADGYLVHNKELCGGIYPGCGSGGICIDQDGAPTSGTGSCALTCTPGQPVSTAQCDPGDVLACSSSGYKICL